MNKYKLHRSNLISDIYHLKMASDVILELLGREEPVTLNCVNDLTIDELLVKTADFCHISPIARSLFAFKQVNNLLINDK